MKPEALLRQQVAEYLQLQYPTTIYRFDLAADIKLSIGQAKRHKHLHPHRGYPDLFIAMPSRLYGQVWAGLFIELKADGKSPYKKDGTLRKDKHIDEQNQMIKRLNAAGYWATFGVGFDECKKIIDEYMRPVLKYMEDEKIEKQDTETLDKIF